MSGRKQSIELKHMFVFFENTGYRICEYWHLFNVIIFFNCVAVYKALPMVFASFICISKTKLRHCFYRDLKSASSIEYIRPIGL